MPKPPKQVLLFRSGRHLGTALTALRRSYPGCEVTVVTTPAAVAALEAHGVDASHRIIYAGGAFFTPWAFLLSNAAKEARMRHFDCVCVLWNDPIGTGQFNVDRTALTVSPLGFTAITADGSMIPTRPWSAATRELTRAVWSIGVGIGLAVLLLLPAKMLRPFRA